MMDRTGLTFILTGGLLVFGLFTFAGWNQTRTATAELQTEIADMNETRQAMLKAAKEQFGEGVQGVLAL